MTLFSMFSINKKEDKVFLLELAETIELLVKIGTTRSLDLAEETGELYMQYSERVGNFDYTKENAIRDRTEALVNKSW